MANWYILYMKQCIIIILLYGFTIIIPLCFTDIIIAAKDVMIDTKL